MSLPETSEVFVAVEESALNDLITAVCATRPHLLHYGSPAFVPASSTSATQMAPIPFPGSPGPVCGPCRADLTGPQCLDEGVPTYLAGASVHADVFALRPDYRALLLTVDGIVPGPGDDVSEALLVAAERSAREALADTPVDQLPQVAAWRDAYRGFGAKPQRTRNSLEALLRRAQAGLPRVNRLTDVYNAISVLHRLPVGGEDLDRYAGPPRLVRATGDEPFDTLAEGTDVVEHPEPGEVVWCDDAGVTCRRWNWRQGRRTQLTPGTTRALFILDALAPMTDDELVAVGEELVGHLRRLAPDLQHDSRLITRGRA